MPRYGDPATDEVMRMQVAPLTPQQQNYIKQYEQPAPVANYPNIKEMYGVELNPIIEERRQRALDRAQQRRGIVRSDSPDLAANSGRTGRGYYSSGGYDPSLEAKQGRTGSGFEEFVPESFGPDQAWEWRAKIRGGAEPSSYGSRPIYTQGNSPANTDIFIPQGVGGRPGEKIINEYGPGFNSGYGSTRVMATADKEGKFNMFSDVPGARTGPGSGAGGFNAVASDPLGVMKDLTTAQNRAAMYRGGSALEKIYAAGLQRHANQLRALAVQQGTLDLHREVQRPDTVAKEYRNWAMRQGDLPHASAIAGAMYGRDPIVQSKGALENRLYRPTDVLPGGLVAPTMQGPGGRPATAPDPLHWLQYEQRPDVSLEYEY